MRSAMIGMLKSVDRSNSLIVWISPSLNGRPCLATPTSGSSTNCVIGPEQLKG